MRRFLLAAMAACLALGVAAGTASAELPPPKCEPGQLPRSEYKVNGTELGPSGDQLFVKATPTNPAAGGELEAVGGGYGQANPELTLAGAESKATYSGTLSSGSGADKIIVYQQYSNE